MSSLRSNLQSFVLYPIPCSSRNNLTRSKMKLTGTISHGWPIIIYIAHKLPTIHTHHLGPFPLDSPIIEGLEKGSNFIFFLELEFGWINSGKRWSTFVACFEVKIRWVKVVCMEIEVCTTLFTTVDWCHIWRWRGSIEERGFYEGGKLGKMNWVCVSVETASPWIWWGVEKSDNLDARRQERVFLSRQVLKHAHLVWIVVSYCMASLNIIFILINN